MLDAPELAQPLNRPGRLKPPPIGFAEIFIRWGWRGVEAVFGSRTGCNVRWLAECGGEELRQRRRQYQARLRELRHDHA